MSRSKPEPAFKVDDRVLILTRHWRGQNQRGTVRKVEWTAGAWRYAVRLDCHARHLTRYNATSLRLLVAVELLGELS